MEKRFSLLLAFHLGSIAVVSAQVAPAQSTSTLKACARAIRADELYPGGRLDLDITGEGMTIHIFELANARATHECFEGRLTNNIPAPYYPQFTAAYIAHATQTASVAIANEVRPMAEAPRGIAYKAKASIGVYIDQPPYITIPDPSTVSSILVSNHSYGVDLSNAIKANDLRIIGGYTELSRNTDQRTYDNPYWLTVAAAGNEGQLVNPSPVVAGFDQLKGNDPAAKNSLTVGGISNITYGANGDVSSATMAPFSSKGPTDDYRIKPEIVALAADIVLPVGSNDVQYLTASSGTSFSSPAVAAACILLQQYYKQRFHVFMHAATVKALALHTADRKPFNNGQDAPPNATYGYGLMNTKAAAEAITERYVSSKIEEGMLSPGTGKNPSNVTYKISSDGRPLKVSLCWTDPAGDVSTVANSPDPRLKNDLDLRVTGNGKTYQPWSLGPTSPTVATTADNSRDPYEQVYIANPGYEEYTITVNNKGTLLNLVPQAFSLVVTGLGDDNVCLANANINTYISDAAEIRANKIRIAATVSPVSYLMGLATRSSIDGAYFNASTEVLLDDQALLKPTTGTTEILVRIGSCSGTTATMATNKSVPPSNGADNGSDGHGLDQQMDGPFNIYPNPTDGVAVLNTPVDLDHIVISDTNGRMVLSSRYPAGKRSCHLDLSRMAPGMYIVSATLADGQVKTYKLVRK